jgi:putative heme-binding domain-containing protein
VVTAAEAGSLAPSIRGLAARELARVPWPEVRQAAAAVLPPPVAKDGAKLPSLAELAGQRGDAQQGAKVFRRPEIGCSTCHQVGREGVDFGPRLTEIGTKLGREALLQAILEPSAGIAFGFEAWRVTLADGDEAYGLLVGETETELTLKLPGAVLARYPKSSVKQKIKETVSAMPADLAATMTRQELLDLVDYLASLKAKPAAP